MNFETCVLCKTKVDTRNEGYVGYLCDKCYGKHENDIVSINQYGEYEFDADKLELLLTKSK